MKTWEMIKVFESFAGIGTQRMALRNLGIEHEATAIAEVDEYALLSYHAIHTADIEVKEASEEEMQRYMEEKNIPLDPKGKRKILKNKRLKDLYVASIASNNLGDISKITDDEIPKVDLFTYSFPCQDISLAGKQRGLDKNSGTRSSLLWECEKIIETVKPKYLLMENVKALVNKNNKPQFDIWLEYLEELGYKNKYEILNAKDYGIPQNRERVFVVSILDDYTAAAIRGRGENGNTQQQVEISTREYANAVTTVQKDSLVYIQNHKDYKFPTKIPLTLRLKDMLEDNVDDSYYLSQKQVDRIQFSNFTQERERIEDYELVGTIYSSASKRFMRKPMKGLSRTLKAENPDTSVVYKHKNQTNENTKPNFKVRKLTPLECWRLMGIADEDFKKASKVVSNSQLYKQAGNAIVVDVLEGIFKQLFNLDENNLER